MSKKESDQKIQAPAVKQPWTMNLISWKVVEKQFWLNAQIKMCVYEVGKTDHKWHPNSPKTIWPWICWRGNLGWHF